ncbi:MAG: hypothetical protein K0B08_10870, partial [Bacteroidales bacterium]|nr:hypothetical protein [Bacteroidales bacterium]
MRDQYSKLALIWNELYPGEPTGIFEDFIDEMRQFTAGLSMPPLEEEWYRDTVVYSLYVDLFNNDFRGL